MRPDRKNGAPNLTSEGALRKSNPRGGGEEAGPSEGRGTRRRRGAARATVAGGLGRRGRVVLRSAPRSGSGGRGLPRALLTLLGAWGLVLASLTT